MRFLALMLILLLVISQQCLAVNTTTTDASGTVQSSSDAVMNLSTVAPSSKGKPPWRRSQADHVMNQGTASKEQYEMIRLVVELMIKPVVCITGLVLNSIGIYVLLKPPLRHGFYIYLAVLSLADVGYLFFGLLRSSVKIYALFDHEAALNIQSTVIPYTDRYMEICLCKLGAYCIMFFSLDRLMAIVRPLHVRANFLSLHSRGICLSLTLFIFIVYIPKILNMEITFITDPNTNLTEVAMKPPRYEDGSPMKTLMQTYGMVIDVLFTYLPPVFVIAINVGIVIQIQRLRRIRKETFSKNSLQKVKNIGQQKLIITVVIISAFFLGVYIPMIIIRNLTVNNPDYRPFHREHYMRQVIPIFVSFGWSINAAIDFTVYLGTSAKFRQILKSTCCCGLMTSSRKRGYSSQSYLRSGKSLSSGTEDSWCSEGRPGEAATSARSVRSTNSEVIVTKTHMGRNEEDVVRGTAYNVVEEYPSLRGSTTSVCSRKALVVDADTALAGSDHGKPFIVSSNSY